MFVGETGVRIASYSLRWGAKRRAVMLLERKVSRGKWGVEQ